MKVVAVVGMTGSGKSEVSDYLVSKGFQFLRMGQLTLDIVRERGLQPTEEIERPIREGLRKDHGPAAFATLNFPKIDRLREKGNVVADGLYSWSEYKAFEEKYGDDFVCISVIASPRIRYARLANRKYDAKKDKEMRSRGATFEQARTRDFKEIENIEKGGPIAMGHYTIVNEGTREELKEKVDMILEKI